MLIYRTFIGCLVCALVLVMVVATVGCSKEEGVGGRSTIKGKVYAREYNLIGAQLDEYFVSEERVYIEYGGQGDFYDDEVRTDYEGRYEFDHLYEGTYTIFVYSACEEECPGGTEPIFVTVEVPSSNEVVEVGTIDIRK